jgi:uncharacterized SAM-binding protein YcdF (DUF218 family)
VLIDFLKDYGHLGSPLTIVVAFGVGVAWLWVRRASAAPRVYLTLLTAGYGLAATPIGADLFVRLEAPAIMRVDSRSAAAGARTIVLLGGGAATVTVGGQTAGVPTASSLLRALEAARVFKAIDADLLVASGGTPRPSRQSMPESVLLRRLVVEAGVPADRVLEESQSTTTAEQALLVRDLLVARGTRRVVLVTSPTHMKRALGFFEAAGVEVIGSMAPLRSEQAPPPPMLLPNWDSLSVSDDAVYEFAARAYYWVRSRRATR